MTLSNAQQIHPSWMWAGVIALAIVAGAARGQQPANADGPPVEAETPTNVLSERQAIIRDRVSRLEDRMFQLSLALQQAEPEKAAQLREALGAARGMLLRQRMEEIARELSEQNYADAVEVQTAVAGDLQKLLKLLLEDPSALDDREEELDRLEALRENLERLIEEQEAEQLDAKQAAAARQRAAAIDAAARQVEKMIEEQADLREQVADEAIPPAQAGELQGALREQAKQLSDDLGQLPELPEGDDGATTSSDAAPDGAEEAAQKLDQAGERMEAAQSTLSTDAARTEAEQKAAEENLREALDALRQENERLRDKLKLDEQAEAQRATAEKTQALADEMRGDESEPGSEPQEGEAGKPGETGEQNADTPGGASGKPQSGGQPPAPGQKSVERATQSQQRAAESLEQANPEQAAEDQEQALEDLRQAQRELDDTLEQLRLEQQEEMLAALEQRFRAMLAMQIDAAKRTRVLDARGRDTWNRTDQLELAEVSQVQRRVGEEADVAAEILIKEGTTVVFPSIVEQVRDDAWSVGEQLAATETGRFVQDAQADIEQTIRELIAAVEEKQDQLASGQQQPGQSGQQANPPLLPGSAELKLLRAVQIRVNNATDRADSARAEGDADPQQLQTRLDSLRARQNKVAELAKSMHESMRRAQ